MATFHTMGILNAGWEVPQPTNDPQLSRLSASIKEIDKIDKIDPLHNACNNLA
jgi:hypothetical protein